MKGFGSASNFRLLHARPDRNGKWIVKHLSPVDLNAREKGNDFFKIHKAEPGIWRCHHCRRTWTDDEVIGTIRQSPKIDWRAKTMTIGGDLHDPKVYEQMRKR
jgi:hypothetical protein